MKVRLTRKLADRVDGIDLSQRAVGDVFDLSEADARVILAEQWGVPAKDDACLPIGDDAARQRVVRHR